MDVPAVVSQGWQLHAEDPDGVLAAVSAALPAAANPGELADCARLAVHVAADHLGRVDLALEQLATITGHPAFEEQAPGARVEWRSLAVLHQLAGDVGQRRDCAERAHDPAHPPASTEVTLQAAVAAHWTTRGASDEAAAALGEALAAAA